MIVLDANILIRDAEIEATVVPLNPPREAFVVG
jgi:hypothetical protein